MPVRYAERIGSGRVGLSQRVEEARSLGWSLGVIALGEEAVSYAMVPVFAPDLVGWMAMGQAFGAGESDEIAEVTGLEPALLVLVGGQWRTAHGRWTPDASDDKALREDAPKHLLKADDGRSNPAKIGRAYV